MKLTKKQYARLVKQARYFAKYLSEDAGFSNPGVNRVALESMLVGWMVTWKPFVAYVQHASVHHKRENIILMAQDRALEAATDVVSLNPKFKTS